MTGKRGGGEQRQLRSASFGSAGGSSQGGGKRRGDGSCAHHRLESPVLSADRARLPDWAAKGHGPRPQCLITASGLRASGQAAAAGMPRRNGGIASRATAIPTAPVPGWHRRRTPRPAPATSAYSPLGGSGSTLLLDPTLAPIGAARACSPAAVALAWTIRSGKVIAIPESGNVMHVTENAVALSLVLTSEDLEMRRIRRPPLALQDVAMVLRI